MTFPRALALIFVGLFSGLLVELVPSYSGWQSWVTTALGTAGSVVALGLAARSAFRAGSPVTEAAAPVAFLLGGLAVGALLGLYVHKMAWLERGPADHVARWESATGLPGVVIARAFLAKELNASPASADLAGPRVAECEQVIRDGCDPVKAKDSTDPSISSMAKLLAGSPPAFREVVRAMCHRPCPAPAVDQQTVNRP
jgi:hypothetical protein